MWQNHHTGSGVRLSSNPRSASLAREPKANFLGSSPSAKWELKYDLPPVVVVSVK